MAEGAVNWQTERVILRVKGATQKALNAIAAQVEAQTKINIQTNGQIDTGAMLNSTYMVTPEASGYAGAAATAAMLRPDAQVGSEVQLPKDQPAAAVACGVEYAIYQETANSFLYRALQQVVPQAGGIIERTAKGELND